MESIFFSFFLTFAAKLPQLFILLIFFTFNVLFQNARKGLHTFSSPQITKEKLYFLTFPLGAFLFEPSHRLLPRPVFYSSLHEFS